MLLLGAYDARTENINGKKKNGRQVTARIDGDLRRITADINYRWITTVETYIRIVRKRLEQIIILHVWRFLICSCT